MLELKNISYIVEDDKEILEDVNLSIDDKFVAITGPTAAVNQPSQSLLRGLFILPPEESFWTERISQI